MTRSVLRAGFAAMLLSSAPVAWAAPDEPAAPAPRTISFAQVRAAGDSMWDRLDANHDGRIDRADRDARLLEGFARWDTNHDGMISKDEFLAHVHARADRAGWQHPAPGEGASPPPSPRPGEEGPRERWRDHHPGGMMAMAIVAPALHEARKDGVIARAAFDAALKAGFDRADTNHDGVLTREELRAAGHAMWRYHHLPWHGPDMAPPPRPAQ